MIPSQLLPLANHLWQTTSFAGASGLLALLLRKNRAQARYWLWTAASVKFLVPFSILIDLGDSLRRYIAPAGVPAAPVATSLSLVIEQVSEPFTATAAEVVTPGAHWSYTDALVPVLIALWAVGFLWLVCSWAVRWRRIRASVRTASSLSLPIGWPVKSSPAFAEPSVFGIVRPVLLLPDGILDCLTPPEMEAIVAHELCHIRRRDNLATAIHMAVESLFWFHPLVWWVGARLIEERERACDEEVLRTGSDPHAYAEGILKVCELYLASPLSCAGVTGGNLKRRIEAIIRNRGALRLDFARKATLAAAAATVIAAPIAIGIMNAPALYAQAIDTSAPAGVATWAVAPFETGTHPIPPVKSSPSGGQSTQSGDGARPKFEVASVKPCKQGPAEGRVGNIVTSPGRLTVTCLPVKEAIRAAYVGHPDGRNASWALLFPIEGGPSWITSDRYNIEAKAEGTPNQPTIKGPMFRTLLEDRFHVKVHRETREMAVYDLVVAKGGSKLKVFDGSCTPRDFTKPPTRDPAECASTPNINQVHSSRNMRGVSLDTFISAILHPAAGRPVINKTGLVGLFDIHLEYATDPNSDSLDAGPTIFEAIQQQLGLRLVPAKGPGEFLVIDHVERPSEN